MKRLFMIGIGGSIAPATIEVHDVRFVYAEKFEDTFEDLRRTWYGDPESLHIDSYKELIEIDGYKIEVGEESKNRLFFINYGGYTEELFGELHASTFVVAANITDARALANDRMSQFQYMNHIDQISDVLDTMDEEVTFGFTKGDFKFSDTPEWQGYIKLG